MFHSQLSNTLFPPQLHQSVNLLPQLLVLLGALLPAMPPLTSILILLLTLAWLT